MELHVQMYARYVNSLEKLYSHPKTWKGKTALQQLKFTEPQKLITPESCICQLCRDDISKIILDPNYNPRWR